MGRTKRFAVYLEDGVMKYGTVSEKPDDPAGDEFPESRWAAATQQRQGHLRAHAKCVRRPELGSVEHTHQHRQ